MYKYRPKRSNFKEYKRFCLNSLEPGIPLFCEDYTFDKLVCGKETVCILGYKYDGAGKTYLVGSFSKESRKHVRHLVEWGRVYLDFITQGDVLEILVEDGRKDFERFATFFGFKKTLAQFDVNGIICTIYVRAYKWK